ncbi:hypothetical protein PVK06_037544 [Gossypium arboreum]|uniref:Uncharacterized protein n=1 Tax=Gossypium arboreum TaxID=29729 RepID=A0ABR0MXN1_GOSAR|nr:hypothetical protein PVK06_037544 [Gossypium arboreum]
MIFSFLSKESLSLLLEFCTLWVEVESLKSEVYSTGLSQVELEEVHQDTGFTLGCLPVRYLGYHWVPLLVRKLTVKDCAPLLEKVVMKVNGWAAKTLPCAGKAQLVQAMWFHIKNYWAWHFLLPKQAIKLVNQMCMRFLWKGQNEKVKVARVTWEQICKPKNGGGLILKDLASWNRHV